MKLSLGPLAVMVQMAVGSLPAGSRPVDKRRAAKHA